MTNQNAPKRVVVSVGPIPARLDSVKFITNRFKGGLAAKTALELSNNGYDVTVVAWKYTDIPDGVLSRMKSVVRIDDVFEYYDWFVANAKNYNAFVMAAAVANLTPVSPYKTKFPSHLYKPGEEFNIPFMIAPRAIDAIKAINPRACLIGYKLFDADTDEELIDIARHTLADAKANIIFANRPSDAKSRKLAVMADNSVVECDFQKHIDLMREAIDAEFYSTNVIPLSEAETGDADIREALATVRMFDKTFSNGFGTVAIPVKNHTGMFATTARGHKGEPVIVRSVDDTNRIVFASGKATLNAPALSAMLDGRNDVIVIHRHNDDPLYNEDGIGDWTFYANNTWDILGYTFPGTVGETNIVKKLVRTNGAKLIHFQEHGYLKLMPILPVDWKEYYSTFPDKYFSTPDRMAQFISRHSISDSKTLELGSNKHSEAKYAYDPYTEAENAINVDWATVINTDWDLVFAKNAVNYLSMQELEEILPKSRWFIANTFLIPPEEKTTTEEASVLAKQENRIRHTLRLPCDAIMRHTFFAHTEDDYRRLGLDVIPYGRNSALVVKD